MKRQVTNLPPQIPLNPLEIQEEDRIFDELQEKKFYKTEPNNEDYYTDNKNCVLKPIHRKKVMSQSDKLLSNIYKITPKIEEQIETAKRKKKSLDLKMYQNNLLLTIGNNLSKQSLDRLERKFSQLRNFCDKYYETNVNFIKELEISEEQIINKINYQGSECEKIMKTTGKSFYHRTNFVLPKIKFLQVIKNRRPNKTFYYNSARK